MPPPAPSPDGQDAFAEVYDELHRLAHRFFRSQSSGHTLQTTAIVHEAFLRLRDRSSTLLATDRDHFYNLAARAMRQILVRHARDKKRLKRGGDRRRVPLDETRLEAPLSTEDTDLTALDDALEALASVSERMTRIVELRFFAGQSVEDTARVLDVSPRTVKSDWAMAKAWLLRHMAEAGAS